APGAASSITTETLHDGVACAMTVLEEDAGQLLSSAQCPLPIRGDEIPKLLDVPSKETGKFLLMTRRYCLHNKGATRDEVVQFLSHQKNQ
ncbi:tRNA nucleotidyl transferase, putative, partial [Bodo saltans]